MSWISVLKWSRLFPTRGGWEFWRQDHSMPNRRARQSRKSAPSRINLSVPTPRFCFGRVRKRQGAFGRKVPVINFSLGKGDWIVKQSHGYGGKVIATVVNARHASARRIRLRRRHRHRPRSGGARRARDFAGAGSLACGRGQDSRYSNRWFW